MKSFIYILSFILLSTVFAPALKAQTIEQISYVPVKTGLYTNLIVKKKTKIGGSLTVTNTLTSNANMLTINANNIQLASAMTFSVSNNIFLKGNQATIGTLTVTDNSNLVITSPSVKIGTLSNAMSVNANTLNVNTRGVISKIYIDGLELPQPSDCVYQWMNVEASNGGGQYKVLACK